RLPRSGGAADAKELTAVVRDPQARSPHLLRVGRAEDVGLEVGGYTRAGRFLLVRPRPESRRIGAILQDLTDTVAPLARVNAHGCPHVAAGSQVTRQEAIPELVPGSVVVGEDDRVVRHVAECGIDILLRINGTAICLRIASRY